MTEPTLNALQQATQLLKTFFDAVIRGDERGMRACLSANTLKIATFNPDGLKLLRFVIGDAVLEGATYVFPVDAYPMASSPENDSENGPELELPCIVIHEGAEWKLDLAATMDRAATTPTRKEIEAAHARSVRELGTVARTVTGALGAEMHATFFVSDDQEDEEHEDVDYLKASTAFDEQELLPMLVMTTLPKLTASLTAICRQPVTASVAVEEFQKSGDTRDTNTIVEWLDNELLEGWTSILATINGRMPFGRRLRAVRIEPALSDAGRMLVLDGSDLLYRVNVNPGDGHYNGEYVETLLPGILAALPAESSTSGKRLIHLDGEVASAELFSRHAVPRLMRRISEMVGRNVTLHTDFGSANESNGDARVLYRWTLNRVLGGIALACIKPARRQKLAEELTTIRFRVGAIESDRYAQYEDGVLQISICSTGGETGAFYEIEIDDVLDGDVIGDIPEEARNYDFDDDDEDEASADDEEGTDGETDDDDDDDDEELYIAATQSKAQRDERAAELARARQLNDENFRTASISLKENEPMWANQLAFFLGHAVTVDLDFGSLNGQFELVQPFIHQGLTSVIEAFGATYGQAGQWGDLFKQIQCVRIAGGGKDDPCVSTLADGTLNVRVPLQVGDVRPPTGVVMQALEVLNNSNSSGAVAPSNHTHVHPANEARSAMSYEGYHPPKFTGDPYAYASQFVKDLESTMRAANIWPGPKPPGEIEIRGAFGMENMAFSQWLGWVMIPRVTSIVETRGQFPPSSNVAGHAVREFDGLDVDSVIEVLRNFDDVVTGLNK